MTGQGETRNTEPRWRTLERLNGGIFDLLVIGGGIVGSRVAYDAASSGLRVALVDAGDFAGATSGASAGLAHGGLRYLKRGDLGSVRAACRERGLLASRIAPHLVKPLPLVATCGGGLVRSVQLVAGLSLYAVLGGPGWPAPTPVSFRKAAGLVPPLGHGRPIAVFYEAAVDDARLTLATVTAAARAGAVVVNHLGVRELRVVAGGISEAVLDADIRVRARGVVNATGPWTEHLRRMEDRRCRPVTRLSKGAHVVLREDGGWRAGLAAFLGDGDHIYAVPGDGLLVLGTTDEEYFGDPSEVTATPDDVALILDKASVLLPELARGAEVLSAFAGLRVLSHGKAATADAPRGHLLSVGRSGMVSVAGGKLTTHRRISSGVIQHLPPHIRPRKFRPDASPLPGAAWGSLHGAPRVPHEVGRHLARVYGSEVEAVLDASKAMPDALEPITPGCPDVWAQVYHAVRSEWAMTVDDVVRRRTGIALRGLDTPEVRVGISAKLGLLDNRPLPSSRTA